MLQASFNTRTLVAKITIGQQEVVRKGGEEEINAFEGGLFPINLTYAKYGWNLTIDVDL